MKLTSRKKKGSNDDNLVPLINVIFLILIFFMVAGQITTGDPFEMTLPESRVETPLVAEDVIRIWISADGLLGYEGETIPATELVERLTAQLNQNKLKYPVKQPPVVVKADATITAAKLKKALGVLQNAGVEQLKLLTLQANSSDH